MASNDSLMKRANAQRFIALKHAFETIYAFAIPSLSPRMFDNLREIEKDLLNKYSKDMDSLDDYRVRIEDEWEPED
jgi:hypothetical protein